MQLVKKDIVYELHETPFYNAFRKADEADIFVLKDSAPIPFYWKGSKIKLEQWQTMLAWMQVHHANEVQCRWYYNIETNEWKVWAFPQEYPTGMSTKELSDHPDFEPQHEREFPDGVWNLFMSVHHHCHGAAGQSGIDDTDERNYPGLHITLGHMDKSIFDWDARISYGEMYYECDPSDWFHINKYVDTLPKELRNQIVFHHLLSRVPDDIKYPEEWDKNLIKPHVGVRSGTMHWMGQRQTGKRNKQKPLDRRAGTLYDLNPNFKQNKDLTFSVGALQLYRGSHYKEYNFRKIDTWAKYLDQEEEVVVFTDQELSMLRLFFDQKTWEWMAKETIIALHKRHWNVDLIQFIEKFIMFHPAFSEDLFPDYQAFLNEAVEVYNIHLEDIARQEAEEELKKLQDTAPFSQDNWMNEEYALQYLGYLQ
jgi:hypothetical protein